MAPTNFLKRSGKDFPLGSLIQHERDMNLVSLDNSNDQSHDLTCVVRKDIEENTSSGITENKGKVSVSKKRNAEEAMEETNKNTRQLRKRKSWYGKVMEFEKGDS